MINFIQNHPLLVIAIGLIIALLLVLAIIKVSNPKSKTKSTATSKASSSSTEKKVETKKETKKEEKIEKKETEEEKKDKKEKKVEQVYQTEKKQEESEEEREKREGKDERELLEKMAFVKTGKTISKLAKREWIEKVPESEFTTEELIVIDSLIREKEIADASKKSSHFNKSIRLSNFTKSGNYDDMFISHISDDVQKISAKKHLNINTAFMEKLYSRSYNALQRSGVNNNYYIDKNGIQTYDYDGDDLAEGLAEKREELAYLIDSSYKDKSGSLLPESEYMNDSIDLGSENILVVDSLMNRKNRKGNKH